MRLDVLAARGDPPLAGHALAVWTPRCPEQYRALQPVRPGVLPHRCASKLSFERDRSVGDPNVPHAGLSPRCTAWLPSMRRSEGR
jgi:hypothetical protein